MHYTKLLKWNHYHNILMHRYYIIILYIQLNKMYTHCYLCIVNSYY
jgi:hypothetical protein